MTLPEFVSKNFVRIQLIIFIGGILIWYRFAQTNKTETRFRSREADRKDLDRLRAGPDLGEAKLVHKPQPIKAQPLALPGIRMNGEAHEILGVDENASEAEIMKAYKESMKRFHPDRIQGQAKEQIQFYEEASSKLNQAKETMLKTARARKV
jgi:DnaJ-domain-containing protein 1